MNPVDEILTPRLHLRRMMLEAFDDLTRMHLDPRVMDTLGGIRSPQETHDWFARQLIHWQLYGYGLWLVYDRASGRFAGRGGLRHVEIDGHDEVEVAYALLPDFWGGGLATELARESIRVAFDVLHLAAIVCFTLTTNRASRRVMQKAGFRYERDIVYKDLPHVLYRLRNSDEANGETRG